MFIKFFLIKIAYVCMVLVWLEGCQGCHRVVISPSEQSQIPDQGGIPNLGATCYMNAVLQIIAKLYPDIFASAHSNLAKAGQVIVNKIKDDQDYVTGDDAEAFYTALLGISKGKVRGRQESADECMDIIWCHHGFPNVDDRLAASYITLTPLRPEEDKKKSMQQLLNDYVKEAAINSENFINDIVPIKINRSQENGPTTININIAAKEALQLTITKTHIPTLSKNITCQLAGFIVHTGSATGGHYFSYINREGQWRLYNDDRVTKVAIDQAKQAAEQAYLFFYETNA